MTNPICRNWENYPQRKMGVAIEHVFREAKVSFPAGVLVDHGCAEGRYSDALRAYGQRLIGVDIHDPSRVTGYDHYIQADPSPGLNYVASIPDSSVDIVLVIASIGMNVHGKHDSEPHGGDWVDYFHNAEGRQGRYFTTGNYPRIVKPGGHIVVQEWEAYPEQRVGRLSKSEVLRRIDEFYPHAEVPGFTMVAKGLSPNRIGPYIVYRKN